MTVAVYNLILPIHLVFGEATWFNRLQCVRDWSGILLERSGKRYSGKPDGGAKRRRNAQRKKTTSQQDYMTTSCWGDVVFTEKTF